MPIFSVTLKPTITLIIESNDEQQITELIDQSTDHITQKFIEENDIDLQISISLENDQYNIDKIYNVNILDKDSTYSGQIISIQEITDTIPV